MEKDEICCCCQHEADTKQAAELTEACRVYRIIQNITNAGCDAEVKKGAACGVPGGGEIPMEPIRNRTLDDFPCRTMFGHTGVSRTNRCVKSQR